MSTALASLRLSPRDAADLRWLLLRDYEGDLGVKSPIGLQLDAAALALPTRTPTHPHAVYVPHEDHTRRIVDLSDEILTAASRLRRLSMQWRILDAASRDVLHLVYATTRRELPEWGDLGPLVLRSSVARHAYERTGAKRSIESWLARLPVRPAAASTTAAIRRDADARLVAACHAWEQSYRRIRRAQQEQPRAA